MKRLVTMVAALWLAMPSIASAQPSASAALSLKNTTAVQPVRASSLTGRKLKAEDNTLIWVAVVLAGGLIIWCIADLCKSKSN